MGSDEIREVLIPKWYDPVNSPGKHELTKAQMESLQKIFTKHGLK